MELIKLILENCVQIIHYIAWPTVALIGLCFFKNELRNLIDRIKEIHQGDNYIVCSDKNKEGGAKELDIPTPVTLVSLPEPSADAKRILATIWQHQKKNFGDDFSKLWSFRVLPNSEVYGTFMVGFAELLKLGLVGWTRKDGQALLTEKGIEYLKKHPELQKSSDVYQF